MNAKLHCFVLVLGLLIGVNAYSQIGGYALKFDGTNDYVLSTLVGAQYDDNAFTLAGWIMPTRYGQQEVFGWGSSSGFNYNIAYLQINDNMELEAIFSGFIFATSSATIPLNTWTHVAYVKDGINLKLYINGMLTGSGTESAGVLNIDEFYLGTVRGGGGSFWPFFGGYMDNVEVWNVARTEAQLRQYMFYSLAGDESNLKAYYKMSDGTGTTLTDNSTNSNNGTINGPTWAASGALDGARKALDFDGTNDYVDFTSSPAYNNSTLTIEAWINPAFINDEKPIVTWFSDWNNVVEFRRGSGKLEFGMNDGGFGAVSGNITINSGDWTHVAVTKDGNNIKLYVNGVLDASGTLTKSNSPAQLRIGGLAHYNTYFQGQIDEVRIWHTVRTETEIRENMTKALIGNEANLVAYYRFNEGAGTTLYDLTGNGKHGTLTNMDEATDWVASNAFNTWIGVENSTYSNDNNWSDGATAASQSHGLYKWNLANVSTYEADISGAPTANNLLISSTSNPTLSSGITVNGNLLLEKNMSLNGQTVTIGPNGALVEGSGVFSGTTGSITTTRNLNNITSQNVGGLGAVITTSANMGSTTITRSHSASGYKSNSILRKYNIVPTNNSGLNATLVFNYLDGELNSNTEADLDAFKSTDDGLSWVNQGGVVNSGNNNLTVTGIDGFSQWTLSSNYLNPIIIYVNDNASGLNDGTSWANAYTSLQSALDAAFIGDQIWVAAGIYKPSYDYGLGGGSRYNHFRMIEGVAIYGGFAGSEDEVTDRTDYGVGGANETILSGDLSGNDIVTGSGATLNISNNEENCYHVFYHPNGLGLTTSAVLDGFTVKGGNANLGSWPFHHGGGLYNINNSPTIRNCNFTSNCASAFGAGIQNESNSSPVITNCVFTHNYSQQGALYNHQSSSVVSNCLFSFNRANNGGAMVNYNNNANIVNCTFYGNYAATVGGGMHNDNCTPTINNSIFWGNTSGNGQGNQIYLSSGGTTTLNYSCYSNGANDVTISSGTFTATNHNTNSNPIFVDAANGDFRLYGDSPCVDAGDNTYFDDAWSLNDIRGAGFGRKLDKDDGNPGTIDMGCYEYKYGADPAQSTPTIQSNTIIQTVQGSTTMTISWTRGNGSYCVAFMKEAVNTGSQAPADNATYTPSANWGSKGTEIGTGWYCIYNGSDANPSVSLTHLAEGELYRIEVFEYNGEAGSEKYLTDGASNNPKTVSTLAENAYVSAGYSEGEGNNPDNNYWGIRYFGNIGDAVAGSAVGSSISTKAFNGNTNVTVNTINIENNTFVIDNADLTVTGDITGSGLIKATGDGYLVLTTASGNPLTFPITDGTNNYTCTITAGDGNELKVNLNAVGTSGAKSNKLWDIVGENDLNATIVFRIDKAAIPSGQLKQSDMVRFLNTGHYDIVPPENVTITDMGNYYVVMVTGVNKF
jgi:hypothetical protein